MKKLLVLFSMMIALPIPATLLSDRSIPSLRESAVYFVENTISGEQYSLTQSRNGKITSIIVEGQVTTIITESEDGKETVSDTLQSKFLVTTRFTRPVFTVRDGEEIVGTLQLKNRETGTLVKSMPISLTVKKRSSGITVHIYRTNDGNISELKIMYFRNEQKLPYEMGIRKTKAVDEKLFYQVILVKTSL